MLLFYSECASYKPIHFTFNFVYYTAHGEIKLMKKVSNTSKLYCSQKIDIPFLFPLPKDWRFNIPRPTLKLFI